MAAGLSYGKKSVSEHWDAIATASDKLKKLALRASECANKDAEGFLPLSKAYGIKAVTDEEKQKKALILEEGLVIAAKAPSELLDICLEASKEIEALSRMSTKLAVSDAGCAAALCAAAAKCAYLNISANTRLMINRAVAEDMNCYADERLMHCLNICDRSFAHVKEVL